MRQSRKRSQSMNSGANHAGAILDEMTDAANQPSLVTKQQPTSVVTRMNFAAPPEKVWEGLMFYEQIGKRPPLLLRLLLPVPIRTEGRKSEVGDEVTCQLPERSLAQASDSCDSRTKLRVRSHRAKPHARRRDKTVRRQLHAACRFRTAAPKLSSRHAMSARNALAGCGVRIEAVVCHSFHRHILSAMRSNLPSR